MFFNGVSNAQLATAPANLREQSLGAVHLGVDLDAHRFRADKAEDFLVLGRITPFKGQDVAARVGEIDPAACRRSVEERSSAGTMAEGYLRLYREVLARTGA